MFNSGSFAIVTGITLAFVSACALAVTPLSVDFDGDVDSDDNYAVRADDPNEGVYGSPSFDIDAIEFYRDDTWFYMAVDTMDDFDRNGGATAFPRVTQFLFLLDDGAMSFFFTFRSDDTSVQIFHDSTPLSGGWEAEIGSDLEIRLANDMLAGFDFLDFSFLVRLDNSDTYADDVAGAAAVSNTPEPTTMGLLALGAIALLRRRRPGSLG